MTYARAHAAALLCALLTLLAVAVPLGATAEGEPKAAPLSGGEPPPQNASPASPPAAPSAGEPGQDGAQPRPAPPPRDHLRVYVLTFTPGQHPFYKFGHNAILIRDDSVRNPRYRDKVYNYGMFSFGDPALIPKFFQGRFMYWMQADPLEPTLRGYQRENRGVEAQELDMPPAMKAELQRLLDENTRPENKFYKYDYYLDNCSTRVRDKIDQVTGGRVKAVTQGPARLTYREQTLRLTADFVTENIILNLVMGDFIDQPVTEWEEDFIPMEFQEDLRRATLVWDDGVERPLVKEETTFVKAKLPPPPANPPILWPWALAVGAGLGGLFALLGRVGVKAAGGRIALGLLLSLFGLVFGFFGWFFLAAWAFTDHRVGYHNENVLLAVPWALVLVGSGIQLARSRAKSLNLAYKVVALALGTTVFDLVAKVLPWFDQKNGFFLVFFLPLWAGAFYALRELRLKWAEPALAAVARPAKPAKAATAAKPDVKDEAKKEGPKAKPAKAKPAKAAKGDEAKADEAKADEAKVDEAKADEAKADEAKADDAKVDEAKADD